MEASTRTGFTIPDRVPWGSHLCQFYETTEDLLEVLVPYFAAGLAGNEACVWVVTDGVSVEQAQEALRAAIPDLDRYLASGQLEVLLDYQWYLEDGLFHIDTVLGAWRQKAEGALREGYVGLRVAGYCTSLLDDCWENWIQYERKVQERIADYRLLAVCTHPLHSLSASQFFQVLEAHDCALVRRAGQWDCIESHRSKKLLNRLVAQTHALDCSTSPLVTLDIAGRLAYANPAALKAWGFTRESEVLNRPATDFWQDPLELTRYMEGIFAAGSGSTELLARRRDGSAFPVEILGSVTKDERGQPNGIVASCLDLTAHEAAQAQLRESEERYRTLVENIDLGITLIDPHHRILAINGSHAEMIGRTVEACIGEQCFRVFEKRDAVCAHCPGVQAMATGRTAEVETVGRRDDGSTYAARVQAFPVRGTDGTVNAFIEVVEDITQRKQVQEQLKGATFCLEQAADCIFWIDPQGNFVYTNRRASTVLGYSPEELRQMTVFDVDPNFTPDEWTRHWELILQRKSFVIESRHRTKSGRSFPVEISVNHMAYDGKEYNCAFARDITDRKQTEHRLIEAKQAAEAANRSKSEFLANMSHEIRTPMTAILGFAEILSEAVVDPELAEAATTICRNGRHLLGIISDILDLSKIEAGKLEVERIPCSPTQILEEVVSLMRVRADGKGLPLEVQHIGHIPGAVLSDPVRIRQILVNLVGNAIKFTEIGSIRITVRLDDAASGLSELTFDVSDTGIGISPDHVAELFQPFVQAESSTTRKYGGSGLGLSISKRLANMLGGDIVVTSRLGEGSTFSLSLPVRCHLPDSAVSRPQPQDWLAESPFALLDRRILLVEDGPDNQRLIAFLLQEAGAEVVLANNGRVAVEIALTSDERFDAILMDMQMPIMDGYEATKALRDAGYDAPIIALTACAMCDDVKKCLATGCSDYLSKPVDRATLVSTVARYAACDGQYRTHTRSVH